MKASPRAALLLVAWLGVVAVDLVEVVDAVRATVEATVRPVNAAVWLRASREDGR